MNRRISLAALIALLILSIAVIPAMAMKPLAVHIEVDEVINPGTLDPFTATGPAVDSEFVCASGYVIDTDSHTVGPPAGTFLILHVTKQFTCGDGSGTFDVDMVVHLDLGTGDTTANWKVVGGTGNYANLKGNGKLVGIPYVPGGVGTILDIYDGKLH